MCPLLIWQMHEKIFFTDHDQFNHVKRVKSQIRFEARMKIVSIGIEISDIHYDISQGFGKAARIKSGFHNSVW